MTVVARITGIFRNHIGDRVFDRLVRIYPEGQDRHAFWSFLSEDDPRTLEILKTLDEAGVKPWMDSSRPREKGREFTLQLERFYDCSEVAACDLVELAPKETCPGDYRDERTGHVLLDVHRLDNSLDFALADRERYVVPDRVKRILEQADLDHLLFRSALLSDPKQAVDAVIPWEGWGPPWWELTSDYTLPPVSPSMDLRDRDGKPIDRKEPNALHVRKEGLYVHPELHYLASDLRKCEPFDLARTWERFGGEMKWNERTLVASKRFYEFCVKHNLKTDWVPVRIDPD